MLVDAAEAWVISAADADRLEAGGIEPIAVGRELEPKKRIFMLEPGELTKLESRRQIPVSLNVELLEASDVVLIPFVEQQGSGSG